jgi:hypothetical protein
VEILSGAGGGLVAVFQHLFQVALVDGGGACRWRRFLHFFARVSGRVMVAAQTVENPLNLTKSKRSRIGFKAG